MIFSSTEIEKAGNDAYINGMARNRNPYIGKQGFVSGIKLKAWYYGWDTAQKDCRAC